LNSKELYAPFKDIDIATLEDSNAGLTIRKAVKLPSGTKNIGSNWNVACCISPVRRRLL